MAEAASYRRTFWRLLGFLRPYKWSLVVSVVLAIGSQAAAVGIAFLTGSGLEEAVRSTDRRTIWLYALAILSIGLFRSLLMMGRRLISGRQALGVEFDMRNALYAKLQRLSFGFYDRHQTGQLMSRATVDLQAVRFFLGYGLIFFFQHITTIVGVTAVMYVANWRLALAATAIAPLIVIVAYRYSTVSHPILREVQQKMADVATVAEESIVGVHVVKSFAQETTEGKKFAGRSEAVFDQGVQANRQRALYVPLLSFLPLAAQAIVLLVGGRMLVNGDLTLGSFIFFNVFVVMDEPEEVTDRPDAVSLPAGEGRVRFEDVSFGYDLERPVLRDVDLELEPGRTVALIGHTGSGKTTLATLVPRFYDPAAGRVTVDGVDVRNAKLVSLRRQIGIVAQDPFLFSDTVRENIAFGRPDASQEEIEEAARLAQAHDFVVTLPEGYDTVIGERGITLSGGQRKRIAIARALLLDPRILILDDATASVDATT